MVLAALSCLRLVMQVRQVRESVNQNQSLLIFVPTKVSTFGMHLFEKAEARGNTCRIHERVDRKTSVAIPSVPGNFKCR